MKHALERARQRYKGLAINERDIVWAIGQIKTDSPYAVFLKKNKAGQSLVAVRIKHRWVGFVVEQNAFPVTAFPERNLHEFRKEILDPRKRQLKAMGLDV